MKKFLSTLNKIETQQQSMLELLEHWANINSSSDNLEGLATMLSEIRKSFLPLGGNIEEIPLRPTQSIDSVGRIYDSPHGNALHIQKHLNAPIKVFLGGHMDTVFPREGPFQKTTRIDSNTLNGPGVADMKGGLVVLLKALEILEASEFAGIIGWEVLINPDEEVGSLGSEPLLSSCAKRNQIGLIFEPAFYDGSLVSSRKGSANFTIVARGRPAHAGRDFYLGRNAISAMSRFILKAELLNDKAKGITVNIGQISGGVASNIVPDLCICHFNLRVSNPEDLRISFDQLQSVIAEINKEEGLSLSLYTHHSRLPKPFDEKNSSLFDQISHCAKELGVDLQCKPSGGVCDGNLLSSLGLPVIDTLGVIGGNLHTPDEYMVIDSLVQRTQLTALFLMQLADGQLAIPRGH